MTNQALLPEGWPRPKGYANGVAAHRPPGSSSPARSAGTPEGVLRQRRLRRRRRARRCENVVAVLRAGGAKPEHIVRMTWYVTSKREYLAAGREIGAAFREIIGRYDIAMTAVEVTALIEDRAKVEIEVTAVVPD